MRLAVISGRACLVHGTGQVTDLADASDGRFSPDIQEAYENWNALRAFAATPQALGAPRRDAAEEDFGNPVPRPRQVFAAGLNYASHAAESSFAVPDFPPVFTKFPSCLTGPTGDIVLPEGDVDWEVELVVVIGRTAHRVTEDQAWDHVAGLTVGQDLSERILQQAGPAPQFGLAKSYPGFGPLGPVVVTPDELPDRDDLELGCSVDGEQMQKGRTRDMVFPVPALIAKLSAVTPLLPGDLVFTGTPAGVGLGRTPQRYLAAGEELVSWVEGIGRLRHRFVAG
jgi:2,4-didehydro-3-deoxy-L-rhamnonate hydrolase